MSKTFLTKITEGKPEYISEMLKGIDTASIMSLTNRVGNIVYVNENFTKVSGYEKDELIGKTHSVIKSGHHPKEFWNGMWSTISKNRVWRSEVKNKKKNGEYYWVDNFIYPIKNDQKIEYFLSIRHDITEMKTQEDKVQELNHKLESIYHSTRELNFLVDKELKIVSHNKASEYFIKQNYRQEIQEKESLFSYLPLELVIQFVDSIKMCLNSGKYIEMEVHYITPNGKEFWFETAFQPTKYEQNGLKCVSINMNNITKRKKYECEIEQQNKKLQNIAWKQSHVLRAPIATLIGLLNLLEYDESNQMLVEIAPKIKELSVKISDSISELVNNTSY